MQTLCEPTLEVEPPTRTRYCQREDHLLMECTGIGDFSYFSKPIQNVIPTGIMGVQDAYEAITSERYARVTRILRTLTNKEMARKYKAFNFDFVCFSGVFTRRCEAGLVHHSSLLALDFDHVNHPGRLKDDLVENPFFETVLAFISPSGDGVKWVIKIDLEQLSHQEWFQAIAPYVKKDYHLDLDPSGKDVCRCCFLPYDKEAWVNTKYI